MLSELHVRDLGVIEEATLVLGPGLTALTGETGAGKTMVVSAIALLLGGRADSVLVRPGATEARVDGRFVDSDGEVVLSRVVPTEGRSRAYIDGVPVTVAQLAERGRAHVELYGQHDHQALLTPEGQRRAVDHFGGVDATAVRSARDAVAAIDAALAALGGDERAQAREADLLRYQLQEIESAALSDVNEVARLLVEEGVLADAVAHREAADAAAELLGGDGGARDVVSSALAALGTRPPFEEIVSRLRGVAAEFDDIVDEVRLSADKLEPDPQRLDAIRQRRLQLRELMRKYGDSIDAVVGFAEAAQIRLDELESVQARTQQLTDARTEAMASWHSAARKRRDERIRAASELAPAIEARMGALALGRARVSIVVSTQNAADAENGSAAGERSAARAHRPDDGSDLQFLLAANAGAPMAPLARVASGGEMARVMLAARLALTAGAKVASDGPMTLVFDEVDAGVGGAAALAVGGALSEVATGRQVLVVTHVGQVAAHADQQITVVKRESQDRTTTVLVPVSDDARVAELARMLSGQPDLASARLHAAELLDSARAKQDSAKSRLRSSSRRKV